MRVGVRHCFTLMEVMIVVLIIGLMTAIATPFFLQRYHLSQQRTTQIQIRSLGACCDQYYLDLLAYPKSLDDLLRDPGDKRWKGPYLNKPELPKDAWGNEFHYQVPGTQGRHYDIYSYGRDNSPGGESLDQDIYDSTEL